jgi:hypothetical protein
MSKRIFHKIVFSLLSLLLLPSFSSAQDSLNYYFDDNGVSKMKSELSIDIAQFIDLSISPKYEYYFNDFFSLSASATYSYGDLVPNHFFPVSSIMSSVFGDLQMFFYSDLMPHSVGYEGELGVGFSSPYYFNNKIKLVLTYGYIYYGQAPLQLTANYFGFKFEYRLIEKQRFFMALGFDMNTLFNVRYESKYYEGDITIGYGLNIGFKL